MTYQLIHQTTQTTRTFSRQFWLKALELARDYGWKPLGTNAPPKVEFYASTAEWDGRYLTNDGQTVKKADAIWLADALERSLGDIPDANPPINWNAALLDDDLPEWLSPEEQALVEEELQDGLLDVLGRDPLDYFAGEEKQRLRHFIRFCRLGSFAIL
jgi:hypothetical protein